jgi:hypothetical protein
VNLTYAVVLGVLTAVAGFLVDVRGRHKPVRASAVFAVQWALLYIALGFAFSLIPRGGLGEGFGSVVVYAALITVPIALVTWFGVRRYRRARRPMPVRPDTT